MEKAPGRRRRPFLAVMFTAAAVALGYAAAPAQATPHRDIEYVALGDSYTAGTGADTVPGMVPGPFVPAFPCEQTPYGYVDLVDRAESVDLEANAACHGALLTERAQPGNVPSVLHQIAALASTRALSDKTDLISMTAGANDVGVNRVLFACATSTAAACAEAFRAAAAAMPAVGAQLVHTFAAIQKKAPHARIVILGYPRLFNPAAGAAVIPVENQILVNQGAVLMNATIASAAARANALFRTNVQYVDVTAKFAGHEVNTAHPWIFFAAFPDANQTLQLDPRSFHPNQAGHSAYAHALLAAVAHTRSGHR